jgi:hypothetical protein
MKQLLLLLALVSNSHADNFNSDYLGQENRAIKSLSKEDIIKLRDGHGWGFAKVAELNGIPGPKHVLEMKDKIFLSEKQRIEIEHIFLNMQKKARKLGTELIKKEELLNNLFSNRNPTTNKVSDLVRSIAHIRGELRMTHLHAHLETTHQLEQEQIRQYNLLRGYSSHESTHSINHHKKHH